MKKRIRIIMSLMGAVLLLMAGILCFLYFQHTEEINVDRTVFNWDRITKDTDLEAIRRTIERGKIAGIYQYATVEDLQTREFTDYAAMLEELKTELYLIYDEQDMNADTFASFLKQMSQEDNWQFIAGIVTDVEPYSQVAEATSAPLEELADFAKSSFILTKRTGRRLLHAIPVWYDKIDDQLCKEIIAAGDGVVLMNYSRNGAIKAIAREYELAQQQGVAVINAIELGDPAVDGTIEVNATYYGETLQTIEDNLRTLWKTYPEIGFGYHQLHDLVVLYENK